MCLLFDTTQYDYTAPLCLQVQLLVSQQDVDNYKQIKSDLDDLRLLVEKSELWVFKTKSAEGQQLSFSSDFDSDYWTCDLSTARPVLIRLDDYA